MKARCNVCAYARHNHVQVVLDENEELRHILRQYARRHGEEVDGVIADLTGDAAAGVRDGDASVHSVLLLAAQHEVCHRNNATALFRCRFVLFHYTIFIWPCERPADELLGARSWHTLRRVLCNSFQCEDSSTRRAARGQKKG